MNGACKPPASSRTCGIVGGALTHEVGGSSDEARWVPLDAVGDLETLSLVPTAIDMLLRRLSGPDTGS